MVGKCRTRLHLVLVLCQQETAKKMLMNLDSNAMEHQSWG